MEWFFTSKCKHPVDENGYALEGEKLRRAQISGNAKTCGAKLLPGAKFCRSCGAPAPGGWWICTNCGQSIGNNFNICPNCGAKQDHTKLTNLKAGVWQPKPGDFAQRFVLRNDSPELVNGLEIQPGQMGILLNGGEPCNNLTPGHYSMDSIEKTNGQNAQNGQKSVIVVQSGIQKIIMQLDDMRTQEGLDIGVSLAVFFRYTPELQSAFIQNCMSNADVINGQLLYATLTLDAIAHHLLLQETRAIMGKYCYNTTTNDLFINPQTNIQIDELLSPVLRSKLETMGIKFLNIGEIQFSGKVFEELQKQAGDVEKTRREGEYELEKDKFLKDQERRKEMQQREQDAYLAELAHKASISKEKLDHDLEKLKQAQKLDEELAALDAKYQKDRKNLVDSNELKKLHEIYEAERKKIQQNAELESRRAEQDERRLQKRADLDLQLHAEKINDVITRMKQDTENARIAAWIEQEGRKQKIKQEQELAKLNSINGMNLQTLIATAQTPAQAQMLLKYQKNALSAEMSPEQILAMGAANGKVEAADALKAIHENKEMYEKIIAQMRDDYAKSLDRDERIFGKAMDNKNLNS